MIKAVVFDLDHTLFDRHATLRALAPEFRKNFKVREGVTDDEIAQKWIYADNHFVYDGWHYIFSYLVENGIFSTPPQYEEYRSFVFRSFGKCAVKFDFAEPMLASLRRAGYKTALITNGYHDLQYKKLSMLGLKNSFDEIIVSGDVFIDKPDKEIFLMMCDKLGLKPGECVYVGDNPMNDIEGARRAGYKTVWVKTTGVWQYSLESADAQVDTVREIPEVTEKLNRRSSENS